MKNQSEDMQACPKDAGAESAAQWSAPKLEQYISENTPQEVVQRYEGLVAAAAAADFGELDNNLVVLDTEATGLSYTHDELIQIAAARVEGGAITEWFITFVDPGKFLTDDIIHLTGITEEDLVGAPDAPTALAQLVEFVGDAKIVAHNVEFDRTFVTKHAPGYPLLENQWIDSLDLARIALPRLKSHRLIDLVRAFGAPLSTHRADADVTATCALVRILFAAVEAMPRDLVAFIAQLAPREDWPTGYVFEYLAQRGERGDRAENAESAEGAEGATEHTEREETDGATGTAEAAESTNAASRASNIPSARRHFSLRSLRHNRAKGFQMSARPDARELEIVQQQILDFPSAFEIRDAFAPDGLVGSLYAEYETRDEQQSMAQAVRSAFESSENLVVEAGTGVGKSMAYLVPALLAAKKNNITFGVATKTNALLDQLVFHELPKLSAACSAAYGSGLVAVPLKGFSHYPCLRKVEKLAQDGLTKREVNGKELTPAPAYAALLSFIEQTAYDDIDGLKLDYRSLPRWLITTTSNECLRRKCPFFGSSCFVHGARRAAEAADIVVTNHSLLFCDLVADGVLLPPIRYWVIDEAHGAEDEARRAYSKCLDAEEILRVANRMSSGEASRNPVIRAERTAVIASDANGEAATVFYALTNKAREQGKLFDEAADNLVQHMKDLLFFDDQKGNKSYETVELWVNHSIRESETFKALSQIGHTFIERAEALVLACMNLVSYLEDCENAAVVQREIAVVAMTLKDMVGAAELFFGPEDERYVYSATLNRRKDRRTEKFETRALNVGQFLEQSLYERTNSVVFASATITAGDSFEPFERALGINAGETSRARTLQLTSSFDFDHNMTVYVAKDMPEPNDPSYLHALEKLLIGVHRAQQGSMLTLFTNRREMEKCFEEVAPELRDEGLRLVCQKWGVSVKGLRDDFLADESLSLFALKSFWEGFDAPGSTLRGVVIPRLPFSKPSDPLSRERAERDSAAWRHYDLPAAVIETKQAVGRLIRKADDKGVVIFADKRLVSKNYGKVFLRSLPSHNVKVCTCDDIVRELEELWQRDRAHGSAQANERTSE